MLTSVVPAYHSDFPTHDLDPFPWARWVSPNGFDPANSPSPGRVLRRKAWTTCEKRVGQFVYCPASVGYNQLTSPIFQIEAKQHTDPATKPPTMRANAGNIKVHWDRRCQAYTVSKEAGYSNTYQGRYREPMPQHPSQNSWVYAFPLR